MVERAAIKLKMDHMIVQSGRLTQNAKLDNKEVKDFMAFGAQQILKATDGEGGISTDKNIDELLAASEKIYDEEIGAKLRKLEEEFNLQGFTTAEDTEEQLQNFEDRYMDGLVNDNVDQELMDLIDLGMDLEKRERKKRVDMDVSKKWAEIRLRERQKQMSKMKTWRQTVGGGHPFQFFNEKRLDVLEDKRRMWTEHLL